MQFIEGEQKDGARFSWNVLPSSRLEATRMAVPIGCLYTPLKPIVNANTPLVVVPYAPLPCKQTTCGAILNPYCRVDFMNKMWLCAFCGTRNHFPHHYAEISTTNRPAEIIPQCTTMEYLLDARPGAPPVFLFVVDTCVVEEELTQLKTSILQSLMLMPENSLVGLITFGRNVHVHELAFDDCPKSYVIRGGKETLTTEQVATLLSLRPPALGGGPAGSPGTAPQQQDAPKAMGASRFLLPVSECELQLTSILEELSRDCWPCKNTERPQRCTGTALSVALGLLEATFKGQCARVMTFVGGPPTVGGGIVVSSELKDNIRSHHDIQKNRAPFFKKASQYYEGLAERAAANGHVVDLFCCSLDQVGLAEMKLCVERTGGLLILDDSFARPVFMNSFKKVFARDAENNLSMAFNGELQVLTSREWKVAGAIGNLTSLDRKSSSVSENEPTGVGNTCAWSLGGLDQQSTVGLYFDVVSQGEDTNADLKEAKQGYVQLVTRYKDSIGRTHLRVSTIAKMFANPKGEQGLNYVRAGFDQEAATILLTRLAVFRSQSEFTFDILRWLDRHLIKLSQKFGVYKKDDPGSFRFTPEFEFYPQFMFYLRRSQFLQIFNSSPDETAFYRTILNRENVTNSLIMIQPTLTAYSLDGPAQPVMLDVSACAANRILVLDTFFHIVIWYGDTIAKWQAERYHERPEYEYLAQLLKAPKVDVQALMESRFPFPRLIECVERGSQSRFLMAKLNPSITQHTVAEMGGEPPVFTEDVSLNVFLQHLRRLAVAN